MSLSQRILARFPRLTRFETPLMVALTVLVLSSYPLYHQPILVVAAIAGAGLCLFGIYRWSADPSGRGSLLTIASLLVAVILCVEAPEILIIAGRARPIVETGRAAILLPDRGLTDSVVQQEEAGRLLLSGIDPYGHDYSALLPANSGPLPGPNPAAKHYVYLPGTVLLSAAGAAILGSHFDLRIWFLLMLPLLALGIYLVGRDRPEAIAFVALTVLSPIYLVSWLWSSNDILFLAPLALALALLQKGRFALAGLLLGAALSMKETAWPILPLVAVVALRQNGWWKTYGFAALAVLTTALISIPFILWSPAAFIDDTVTYLGAGGHVNVPVFGWDIPALFLKLGFLHDPWQSFPGDLLELALAGPMLVLGMWALWRSPSLSRFFAWSGLTLLAVVLSLRIGLSHYYVVPLGLVAMATWSWLSDQRIRADFRCIVVTR